MTLTTPRKVLLGVLLLAAVGGAGWMAGQRQAYSAMVEQAPPAAPPQEVAPSDIEEPAIEPKPVAARTTSTSTLPLPPRDAPPAQVIAELLPRARAGDARAACRIAVERLACDAIEHRRDKLLKMLRRDEETSLRHIREHNSPEMTPLLEQRADRYAELQIAVIERDTECAAIPSELRENGVDWLARAAASGHPESMLRYATGQSLGFVEGLDGDELARWRVLGHPGFDAWRRDAPIMLQRMLESGQPEAAFVLFFAYLDDATLFSGMVRNDPAAAAAMQMVLDLAHPNPPTRDRLSRLDARQRQEAIARFDSLRGKIARGSMNRQLLESALDPPPLEALSSDDDDAPCE